MTEKETGGYIDQGEPLDVEQLRKERVAALLGKWSKGQRLSSGEMDEISHRLPKVADDLSSDPGADSSEHRSEEFFETRLTTRPRYNLKLDDYCGKFGVGSVRTIKRWISIGKNSVPSDFPPLDSPELLASWWERLMSNRIPLPLQLLSEIGGGKEGEARKNNKEGKAAAVVVAPALPEGSGFAAELERIRHDTRVAAAEKGVAKKSGDPLEFQNAVKRYETQLKLLREFERDAEKILQASGDLLPRRELELVIREKHSVLVQSLRALVNVVDPELAKLKTREQRRKSWNEALDRVFIHLNTSRWSVAWSAEGS